jgi:DNA repair exonuclease SbcCD ATPase subunit
VVEKVNMETQEEKQHTDKLEQKLKEVFTRIPDNAQEATSNAEEHIQIIVQMLEDYKKEIEDLKENLTPTTPPEVTAEREQHASLQVEMMEKEAKKVTQLFDRTAQLWTTLEEDDRVQQLDQQEEEINTAIQELKQQQNSMSITERLKGTQEMKTLQTELKTAQNNKQARQAQLEPLQEKATQIIVELEEEKTRMAQDHAEST